MISMSRPGRRALALMASISFSRLYVPSGMGLPLSMQQFYPAGYRRDGLADYRASFPTTKAGRLLPQPLRAAIITWVERPALASLIRLIEIGRLEVSMCPSRSDGISLSAILVRSIDKGTENRSNSDASSLLTIVCICDGL